MSEPLTLIKTKMIHCLELFWRKDPLGEVELDDSARGCLTMADFAGYVDKRIVAP